MQCRYCQGRCIKKGQRNGCQKLQCKSCNKFQQLSYVRRKFDERKQLILEFLQSEGCSISTLSRFLRFSKTTICNWIFKLGSAYDHLVNEKPHQEYQADELRTFIGNKKNECWIMYAINKYTKSIVSWCVGRRTSENIRLVTNKILAHDPKIICTDRLIHYRALIPKTIHEVKEKQTNHIERMNLQFRNRLKRLSRKTICFSKSESMLRASVNLCVKYMTRGSSAYEFAL